MNTIKLFLLSLAVVLLLAACDNKTDVSSPLRYDKNNISFSYPKNWEISDGDQPEGVNYIIAEGSNALFMAQLYTHQDADDLATFAERYSLLAMKEMSPVKVSKGSFSEISNVSSTFEKGLQESFNVTLLGFEVPHLRQYYIIKNKSHVIFLITQIATEDSSDVEAGLDLILHSFSAE